MTRTPHPKPARLLSRLRRDRRGLALLEFAFSLPIVVMMTMTGAELCNYITYKMRVSQLALQMADNAARMGEGDLLSAKTISETDINDVFIGGNKQAGSMALQTTGRVILSDLEPDPNHAGKYKIMWQRCFGNAAHVSRYGVAGQDNLTGIGPVGNMVTAQTDNATMFVEIYVPYRPLLRFATLFSAGTTFDEYASMAVRDRRDLTQIYNTEHATVANC